ncbi:MAG: zinc finger MYND domain-containing protein [Chlamydiales bacterium]|nr:zinc finger MYND domain-containing protein [Chlamydiales bacterium]
MIAFSAVNTNINYCGACEKANASKLCGKCKKVNYCNRECQVAHWAAHKVFCYAWYENNNLWGKKLEDLRIGCVPRAKNFVENVLKHIPNPPTLKYFIIARKPNENFPSLSYEDSRNIPWIYHVVLEYSDGNNRYIIDPLKHKKLFEYAAWISEITQGYLDKFKYVTVDQFEGVAVDQLRKPIGVAVNGKILEIDQDCEYTK